MLKKSFAKKNADIFVRLLSIQYSSYFLGKKVLFNIRTPRKISCYIRFLDKFLFKFLLIHRSFVRLEIENYSPPFFFLLILIEKFNLILLIFV